MYNDRIYVLPVIQQIHLFFYWFIAQKILDLLIVFFWKYILFNVSPYKNYLQTLTNGMNNMKPQLVE